MPQESGCHRAGQETETSKLHGKSLLTDHTFHTQNSYTYKSILRDQNASHKRMACIAAVYVFCQDLVFHLQLTGKKSRHRRRTRRAGSRSSTETYICRAVSRPQLDPPSGYSCAARTSLLATHRTRTRSERSWSPTIGWNRPVSLRSSRGTRGPLQHSG